jgi:hypothetical protein
LDDPSAPTDVYVKRATDLIEAFGSEGDPNRFCPEWYKKCKARFDQILSAMLDYSVLCSAGDITQTDYSRRYVACTIVACTGGSESSDDTHRALSELALSWFNNLLWLCKPFFAVSMLF